MSHRELDSQHDDLFDEDHTEHDHTHVSGHPSSSTSAPATATALHAPRPTLYSGKPEELPTGNGPYLNNLVDRIVKETQDAQTRTATPIPDSDGLSWPCEHALEEGGQGPKNAAFKRRFIDLFLNIFCHLLFNPRHSTRLTNQQSEPKNAKTNPPKTKLKGSKKCKMR